jgi:hypothetical protein
MKTITEHLNELSASIPAIKASQEAGVISKLFCSFFFDKEKKTEAELKEALEWFLDGGSFASHWRESLPYGERKNSKKRQKTTWFLAEKGGVEFQLGHATVKNYVGDFWERGAEALVKSALCKEGEFSYYNNSFINYVLEKGVEFKDLGEKK